MDNSKNQPEPERTEGVPSEQPRQQRPLDFPTLLKKTIILKDFAVANNYELNSKIIAELNDLACKFPTSHDPLPATADAARHDPSRPAARDCTALDTILSEITATTFPTTIDTLSDEIVSPEYKRFTLRLLYIGGAALVLAIIGFVFSAVKVEWMPIQLSNSVLAMSLGLLGAVVYSFFGVLRVVPSQAFNPRDEYSNYARLLLGVLLGWIFYFIFARLAFEHLSSYITPAPAKLPPTATAPTTTAPITAPSTEALLLLVPFVAGYSTRFVIGILERAIVALETALGITDKRDTAAKRIASRKT
jgi:hypothetical protein